MKYNKTHAIFFYFAINGSTELRKIFSKKTFELPYIYSEKFFECRGLITFRPGGRQEEMRCSSGEPGGQKATRGTSKQRERAKGGGRRVNYTSTLIKGRRY